MHEREAGHEPSGKSPLIVEWNNSRAIVENPELIAFTESSQTLYDRADFATPIERAQVFCHKKETEEGEEATKLEAFITLDRTRQNLATLLDKFRTAFVPNPIYAEQGTLKIEETYFRNTIRVSHISGSTYLLYLIDKGEIQISNHAHIVNIDETIAETVQPKPRDISDPVADLTGFLQTFMRAADIASFLDQNLAYISGSRLSREYALTHGKDASRHPRFRTTVRDVGKSSVQNTQRSPERTDPADLPEITPTEAKVSIDDVGGLHDVKKALKDIASSFNHPEIMEKWGAKRPQGVLLYGPPGTGKTMLTEALANEIGAEFWAIQSSDIYHKWLGQSEESIKDIFNRASNHEGPLIVFFDEFESIVSISNGVDSGGSRAMNSVAGIFKQEMNKLAEKNPNVLIVAATNDYDSIDPALIRSGRFDHKIYVPMPDTSARIEIIVNTLARFMRNQESGDFKVFGEDVNAQEVSELTDDMSGADIAEIFRRLTMEKAMQEARSGEVQVPIMQTDIRRAIVHFRTNG